MAILNIGSKGDEVKKLQQQLNTVNANTSGYTPLVTDGIYGNNTAGAVTNYQTANNLTPDGIVGDQTLGSLYKSTAPTVPITPIVPTVPVVPAATTVPVTTGGITPAGVTPIVTPASTTPAVTTTTPTITPVTAPVTPMVGLRDYATTAGLNVDWTRETGPTVDGHPIDTSGLTDKDGHWYGTEEQMKALLDPIPQYQPTPELKLPEVKEYKSPYEDLIKESYNKILNNPAFKYDPNTDQSYQSYLTEQTHLGQVASTNTLAQMSAMTGGRLNSWAASAAAGAAQEYASRAASAMPQFRGQALDEYNSNLTNLYKTADMLFNMDNTEFDRWKYTQDVNYKTAVDSYNAEIDKNTMKQKKIENAWVDVNNRGYVNNSAGLILGVHPGTLSKEAQAAKDKREQDLADQKTDLANQLKVIDAGYQANKKLADARTVADVSAATVANSRDVAAATTANNRDITAATTANNRDVAATKQAQVWDKDPTNPANIKAVATATKAAAPTYKYGQTIATINTLVHSNFMTGFNKAGVQAMTMPDKRRLAAYLAGLIGNTDPSVINSAFTMYGIDEAFLQSLGLLT